MTPRTLASVVTHAWERHMLLNLTLELTYVCELSCEFCYNDREKRGTLLSLPEYRTLLSDARRLGCLYLTLTGGEPTRSRVFFDLGRLAREAGFCVRIKTHGAYRDPGIIERIKAEIDPLALDVSLHGADAATHDRLTGVAGSFQQLRGNLDSMKRAQLQVTLRCPLTSINEHQIEEITALAARIGYPVRFDPDIFPRDNGDRSPLQLAPSREGVLRLYRLLAAQADSRSDCPGKARESEAGASPKYNCGAGTGALTVDPYGEVLPCVAWRIAVGNLRESTLEEIWTSSKSLNRVREDNRLAGARFGNGRRTAGLPFCPGRAHQETGNGASLYPALVQLSSVRTVAIEE